jgi:Sec-independent protein translocase protein TatA
MFDISLSELVLIFVVGALVLKPKDLVNVLQKFNKLSKFDKKLSTKDEEAFLNFNKANLFDQNNKVGKVRKNG